MTSVGEHGFQESEGSVGNLHLGYMEVNKCLEFGPIWNLLRAHIGPIAVFSVRSLVSKAVVSYYLVR